MNNIFSNLKKYIFIISLFILFLYGLAFPCSFADELETNTQEITYKTIINEYLNEISIKLKDIDSLILYMKSQKEYTKYPAVRLNMQTPFLGISAITENKLQISENVSIFDRTTSYSIRDVLKKKIVKIPSFSIASIVLLTKDIDINAESYSKDELIYILNSLKSFKKQAEDVYDFVETQKNNIFFDYVSKDIKTKIDEYKGEVVNIQNKLLENEEKLILIKLSKAINEENEFSSLKEKQSKLYNDSEGILKEISNILITEDELKKVESSVSKLKEDLESLNTEINLAYDVDVLNLDANLIETNIRDDLKSYIIDIEKIVSSSKVEQKLSDDKSIEVVTKFEIKNTNILENLTKFYEELDKSINERNNQNAGELTKKVYTNNEELLNVNSLIKRYISLTLEVRNFYKENINNLYTISVKRAEEIVKYTDVNVSNYLNGLYFKFVENKNISNLNSTIISLDLINTYKNKIDELIKISEDIYSIYDEKLKSGEIKS